MVDDKITELLSSLERINLGSERIMIDLVADFVRIIKSRIDNSGWDSTKKFCLDESRRISGISILSSRLRHLYSQAYAKMRKIDLEAK